MKKRALVVWNIGDEILPSYVGIIQRKHEIRIPELSNLDSMASKTVFFVAQIVIQNSEGFSYCHSSSEAE